MFSTNRIGCCVGIAAGLLAASPLSAAITAGFNQGRLTITVTAPDSLVASIDGSGFLKLNGEDPSVGPVAVADVRTLQANLESEGASVDLSALGVISSPAILLHTLNVRADDMTVQGPAAPAFVSILGAGIIFTGSAHRELVDVDGRIAVGCVFNTLGGNDEIIVTGQPVVSEGLSLGGNEEGETLISSGQTELLRLAGADHLVVNLGDEGVMLVADSTFPPPIARLSISSSAGDDVIDVASYIGDFTFSSIDIAGHDSVASPVDQDTTSTLNFTQRADAVAQAVTVGFDGGMVRVASNTPDGPSVSMSRVSDLFITSGDGNDTFEIGELSAGGVMNVFVRASDGDDLISAPMSGQVRYDLHGGDGIDSVEMLRNGFPAFYDGNSITAPGSPGALLTDVESVAIVGTFTPQAALPMLLGALESTRYGDANHDDVVDAGDLRASLLIKRNGKKIWGPQP